MTDTERILEDVYSTNVEKLYRFFYFKVLNKQVAEDLTSDTFMALAEKVNTLSKDKDSLEKYLYGIAKNKWNMYLRNKYKQAELSTDDIDDFSHYVTSEVEEMERRSLKERALYFIDMLPPKLKVVAMLRLIEGLLPTEIAVRLKKPLNYVKVTLRRALRRLEELVAGSRMSASGETEP
jgi:RNA polymerase sigma-70 factor (ECF subfamily)